jgi:hypothetical protein
MDYWEMVAVVSVICLDKAFLSTAICPASSAQGPGYHEMSKAHWQVIGDTKTAFLSRSLVIVHMTIEAKK